MTDGRPTDGLEPTRAFDDIEGDFNTLLDRSLGPRDTDHLFELVASLDIAQGAMVVDVGCGRGTHSATLAERFGFRVLGIDPAPRFREDLVGTSSSGRGEVWFEGGSAENIPAADSSVDLLWCREITGFIELESATQEFRRVLRPGGRLLVFDAFMGSRISKAEADELSDLLRGRSVWADELEDAIVGAGFDLTTRVEYESEMGEHAQEKAGVGGQRLLRAARLLRAPDRYVKEFGRDNYEIMLGDCLWHVYRMIGKTTACAFVFTAPRHDD